jgi:hypothetical protein
VFCAKVGHNVRFCPSLPTEPEQKVDFVESLLNTPRLKLKRFEGLGWGEVASEVARLGGSLNEGNPWREDARPLSALRRQLGFWKIIGADKSVLSWLAYGFQMRFAREPGKMAFRNHPNVRDWEAFVDKEVETHLADGSFTEVKRDEAWVINPFLIAVGASGKPRRCDDMRYVNGFLAGPTFKLQTLDRDVPNVVREGDVLLTRDLEKVLQSADR